jgi:hypothetical protein
MSSSEDKPQYMGWAELECFLSCETLPVKKTSDIIAVCQKQGFQLKEGGSLLAYGPDPCEPERIASAKELNEFLDYLNQSQMNHCIVNLTGTLLDIETKISLILEFKYNVLSISINEAFIWGFSEDPLANMDFRKLVAFGNICKEMASEVSPKFVSLGTESVHADEMQIDQAESNGASPYDPSYFSEEELKKDFNWYKNDYIPLREIRE